MGVTLAMGAREDVRATGGAGELRLRMLSVPDVRLDGR
jgi:hypothetical protein